MRVPFVCLLLSNAAASVTAKCPCDDAALCAPLTTPAAEKEIFAYATKDGWKHYLNFANKPTTIGFFGDITSDFVCNAHKHGTRVVRGLDFEKKQFTNAAFRSAWVKTQVADVTSLGYDGFNIDIEGNTAHKHELTALVTELAAALRKANPHSQLSFARSVYPMNQQDGYDDGALSKVLDFIVPMAYDECWSASKARANSPLPALAVSVQQYAHLGVPAGRLVMGLPWYAWDFPCDSAARQDVCKITVPRGKPWFGYVTQTSYSFANVTAAKGYSLDKESMTMVAEYFKDEAGTKKRHQVWFDNPQTLIKKYEEVAQLGMKGVAFWTADEVNYTTSEGRDMWAALSNFRTVPKEVIV